MLLWLHLFYTCSLFCVLLIFSKQQQTLIIPYAGLAHTPLTFYNPENITALQAEVNPSVIALDTKGNAYLGIFGSKIYKISSKTNQMTTILSGSCIQVPAIWIDNQVNNLYYSDMCPSYIYKIDLNTLIRTKIIGNINGYGGDGGNGTSASVYQPLGIWGDSLGQSLYIADQYSYRIRKYSFQTLKIITYAGTGTSGYSGDTGPATSAQISLPTFLTGNPVNNDIYFYDSNSAKIRKIASTSPNIITTVISNSVSSGIWIDTNGYYLFYMIGNYLKRFSLSDGTTTIIAGTGTSGYSGDNGPAISAKIVTNGYAGLSGDTNGNIYILDGSVYYRIRKVTAFANPIQIVTRIGNGFRSFRGDGGPATSAELDTPNSIWLDTSGNGFITDNYNCKIRRVTNVTGIIKTYAGYGSLTSSNCGYGGDGKLISLTSLGPSLKALWGDPNGNLFFSDANGYIRKSNLQGNVSTIAILSSATVYSIWGDTSNHLYVAMPSSQKIFLINTQTNIVSTFAGTGTGGYNSDNIPASNAQLNSPYGVWVDSNGLVLITDKSNHRIRQVSLTGIISTYVGSGSQGYNGNNLPATTAMLNTPSAVMGDSLGNLYISDSGNYRIRLLNTTKILLNLIGTGSSSYSSSFPQLPNTVALQPNTLFVDSNGQLYYTILSSFNQVYQTRIVSYPTSQPSSLPTSQPSRRPTGQPTGKPSRQPTGQPTRQPTGQPSRQPTSQPTSQPVSRPTGKPTGQPSSRPSVPTSQPTCQPTGQPNSKPSSQPSSLPTKNPTSQPSSFPTSLPSTHPSINPTSQPTIIPSCQPSSKPSACPTSQPTGFPTTLPTSSPTEQPTSVPSSQPTAMPISHPSSSPSRQPTNVPSSQPSVQPSSLPSSQPTVQPTVIPSSHPTNQPTSRPTSQPSIRPTSKPTLLPSSQPTIQPSSRPSSQPTSQPTQTPTSQPTDQPTSLPYSQPTTMPVPYPTSFPNSQPSNDPTSQPSLQPTSVPSSQPTVQPTRSPSSCPTVQPTSYPSSQPTECPTTEPTLIPSSPPSSQPSKQPTSIPTHFPTVSPSTYPSSQPSEQPTNFPTTLPTSEPSVFPTSQPSIQPSCQPSSSPSRNPTGQPTSIPSSQPSVNPSMKPTTKPSVRPTRSPTDQPSSQPSSIPSIYPSTQPTNSPSSFPSIYPTGLPSVGPSEAPSNQPTCKPSSQPTGMPSSQPSARPSRIPSRQPSGQPSVLPTSQPSVSPSKRPYSSPTSRPSSFPSVFPTTHPSRQPTSRPSSQPQSHPSSKPTSRPVSFPTSIPSTQPTAVPSAQPYASPTSHPSTAPTINRLGCLAGTYYALTKNKCIACPEHSSSNTSGVSTCTCDAGFSQLGFGVTLNCSACPSGQISTAGSRNCNPCSAGSFVTQGAVICQLCPINFYNPQQGQTRCVACPAGLSTVGTGSTSSSQCISPIPNFTLSVIALSMVVLTFGWYIFFGRFYRISFERRIHSVLPNFEKCKRLIFYQEEQQKLLSKLRRKKNFSRRFKLFAFIGLGSILFFLSVVYCYIMLTYQVFFNSLILWRGLKTTLNLQSILMLLENGFRDIFQFLQAPNILKYAVAPFFYLFQALASVKINLTSVSVTCSGSQAPIELMVDCLILGLLIIIIRSEYQVLLNSVVLTANRMYLTSKFVHFMENGKLPITKIFYFALAFTAIIAINPFQILLRYCMGFVSINSFAKNNHLAHDITRSCDRLPTAPYFDSILGYTSTIFAWWLILPAIFCLAEVVVTKTKLINSPTKSVNNKKGIFPEERLNESSLIQASRKEVDPQLSEDFKLQVLREFEEEIPGQLSHLTHEEKLKAALALYYRYRRKEQFQKVGSTPQQTFMKNILDHPYTSTPLTFFHYCKDGLVAFLSVDLWMMNAVRVWMNTLDEAIIPKSSLNHLNEKNNVNNQPETKTDDEKLQLRSLSDRKKLLLSQKSFSTSFKNMSQSFKSYRKRKKEKSQKLEEIWLTEDFVVLPTYYALCLQVRDELHDSLMEPFATFFAILGIGHFFTQIGRYYWWIVYQNYKIFFLASLGIWTTEVAEAYDLIQICQNIISEPESSVNPDSLSRDQQAKTKDVLPTLISVLVGTRALLYQIIPSLVLFSTFVTIIAPSPVFVYDPFLQENLPSLIIYGKENLERCIECELALLSLNNNGFNDLEMKRYLLNHYSWRLLLRKFIVFWNDSRLLQLIKAVLSLGLSLTFLIYDRALLPIILGIVLLLTPFIISNSILILLYLGKSLDLTDQDIPFSGYYCCHYSYSESESLHNSSRIVPLKIVKMEDELAQQNQQKQQQQENDADDFHSHESLSAWFFSQHSDFHDETEESIRLSHGNDDFKLHEPKDDYDDHDDNDDLDGIEQQQSEGSLLTEVKVNSSYEWDNIFMELDEINSSSNSNNNHNSMSLPADN